VPAVSRIRRSRRRVELFRAGGAFVVFDNGQDDPGHALNSSQRLRQRGAVASIEVDVVAGRVGDVESDRLSNNERNGFGFELPRVTRGRSVVAAVQQLMRLCSETHKAEHFLAGGAAPDRSDRE
jgi:hypothetical protein